MLRAAGAEHGEALVVNTSSITGKIGEPGLGVYSATKHGLVGFTQAMQRELGPAGIKSCVLCPGLRRHAASDYVKDSVAVETMIRSEDVAESVRALLRLSSAARHPGDHPAPARAWWACHERVLARSRSPCASTSPSSS